MFLFSLWYLESCSKPCWPCRPTVSQYFFLWTLFPSSLSLIGHPLLIYLFNFPLAFQKKFNAQLCNVIKSIIHTPLKSIFCPEACASVWSKARVLYASDTVCLRHVPRSLHFLLHGVLKVLCLIILGGFMLSYMILMSSFHHLLMWRRNLINCSTFFMTLGLYGLVQEYVATCEEIFRSPINLTMTFTSFFCSWKQCVCITK